MHAGAHPSALALPLRYTYKAATGCASGAVDCKVSRGHLVASDELLQFEHDALPRRQRRAAPGGERVLGSLHRCLELGRGRLWAARYHLLCGLAT